MKTLYLRNVPDEVIDRLERLARRSRRSVTAVAIDTLEESTRYVDNAALFADLPSYDIDPEEVVRDIEAGRAER